MWLEGRAAPNRGVAGHFAHRRCRNGAVLPLVRDASRALRPGGALAIETHQDGASDVSALLDREGYVAVGTTKDLAGRDRVVEGRTPA